MSSFVNWTDIRAEYVERAGGEGAVKAGKKELLAEERAVVTDRTGTQSRIPCGSPYTRR